MVTEFVKSRCYKSHELAQASLLRGTVAQVSDVAYGTLVSGYFYILLGPKADIMIFSSFYF